MQEYRCYFLGPDGRIVARREFRAESDNDALTTARGLYSELAVRHGFELWENKRHVHREE
jgi:hypothetical protein